jgi:hypothetical protein
MKRHLVTLPNAKKMLFAIFCSALLMLFSAPAWAVLTDPCLAAGAPAPCGITITISGSSGQLSATIATVGTSYDGTDDQIVGIINASTTVTVGAIRLSSPLGGEVDNLFQFDGDGPACYFYYEEECPIPDPVDYEGPNDTFVGISADYTTGTISFVTPIPPNGSTWFALEGSPATVVSIGETQQLVTGVTNVFPFGPYTCTSDGCSGGYGTWTEQHTLDDAQFTPVSQLTGADYWTVLPVPVCAGPLGESPFGPFTGTPSFGFTTGDFGLEAPSSCPSYGPSGFVTNFLVTYPNVNSLAIVPYSDYSSPNDPIGIELERDCIGPDCGSQSLQWTMQLDYDIDPYSIAGPIGGPVIGFAPGLPGPISPNAALPYAPSPTDFSVNALTSYTGAVPGEDPPPPRGGGKDGKSVFASLFSPAQSETNPIPPGVTVGFPGYEFPTSNTSSPSCTSEAAQYLLFPSGKQVTITAPVNCLIKFLGIRLPWPLVWDYTTTSNTPITNLQLCTSMSGGSCTTPGVNPPWVYVSLVPVGANCGTFTGQNPLPGIFTNLNKLGFPGQYSFVWTPVNNPKGCEVAPVLQFDTGTIVSPATFIYAY